MAPKIISFTTLIEKDLENICVDSIVNKLITTQIIKQIYDGIVWCSMYGYLRVWSPQKNPCWEGLISIKWNINVIVDNNTTGKNSRIFIFSLFYFSYSPWQYTLIFYLWIFSFLSFSFCQIVYYLSSFLAVSLDYEGLSVLVPEKLPWYVSSWIITLFKLIIYWIKDP